MFQLRDVTRTYGDTSAAVHALRGVDLDIDDGEMLVIAGPSGSGKTTVLQLLGGLDRATAGRVCFEGQDLGELGDGELTRLRREAFGFVFQQFNLIPTLTAAENVEVPLAATDAPRAEREHRVAELLENVGLGDRTHHLPGQLSGGEQQRVAIARALANRPRVILADEPTGNLDSSTGAEVLDALRRLNRDEGRAVVLISHDPSIGEGAPRLVRLADGRVVADRSREGTDVPPAPRDAVRALAEVVARGAERGWGQPLGEDDESSVRRALDAVGHTLPDSARQAVGARGSLTYGDAALVAAAIEPRVDRGD